MRIARIGNFYIYHYFHIKYYGYYNDLLNNNCTPVK